MRLNRRRAWAGAVPALGLTITLVSGGLTPAAASVSSSAGYVALSGSSPAVRAARMGSYSSGQMSVEVALAPQDQMGLNARLRAQYTEGSPGYHHWLAKGQFDKLYAPSAAKRSAVAAYLASSGLKVQPSASPFLVRAVGSSQQVSAAFRTTLSTYQAAGGSRFFANSTAVQLPAALAPGVQGVVGLNNDYHLSPGTTLAPMTSKKPAGSGACQTPYPTETQLSALATSGTTFPFGYGGGPACSGLTPSQVNSIYGAPDVGPRGKGAGVTMAVVEFTSYQESDSQTWAQTFYGPGYTMPQLDNVLVDGGPLNPDCPSGDPCPASYNGYIADWLVDLDIERYLTVSPDASKIIVYNAPNDTTGQTVLDEYTRIADDDTADVISSAWSAPEDLFSAAYVQSENVIFEQMAAQGQAYFESAGDEGPLALEEYTGSTALSVRDPSAQPYVTSVGGTSLEDFNPGTDPDPRYPAGVETVWNSDNLCQDSSTEEGGVTGYAWCIASPLLGSDFQGSAGAGGSSMYWGRPFYQTGEGVSNPYTTDGNGSTQCSLAADGTPCREIPDVSAIADEYTPFATYCTGSASLPNSACYPMESGETDTGWFGLAGTASSAPLWAGIAADRDSYTGGRSGFFNPLLYALFNADPGKYFNDITGAGQTVSTNGLFPATPGYDEATGIGTPKMAALITESG